MRVTRRLIVASGLGVALLAPLITISALRGQTEQPNIVFVLFDDADQDVTERLPNVRSLIADKGATFDRFYATQPLCCPSRASMLTGEYVHNHGVGSNNNETGGYATFASRGHEARTVGVALRQAGYQTGLFGKYLNHYGSAGTERHVPQGWSRWFATFGQEHYDYRLNDNGKVRRFGSANEDYADGVITRTARRWIDGLTADDAGPFFAFVSVLAPHAPYVDPPGLGRDFRNASPSSFDKPSFDEADRSDKPSFVRERPRVSADERRTIRVEYRKRLRMMAFVDRFVRRLVSDLEASGEIDNTYIFVSSDNGWMQGEHAFVKKKLVAYEESVRLPLFVRGPGIAPGTHIDELASMLDLYPTFTALARSPEARDGRSLAPLLHGETVDWRTQLLIENLARREERTPNYFGVVTPTHKYVEYPSGERELYDLAPDPFELESRHDTADPQLLAELQAKLAALKTCSGSGCRTADSL